VLWSTGDIRYVAVVDTVASVAVDRTNLGVRMAAFLSSDLPAEGLYPTLAFAGAAAAEPTVPAGRTPPATPPGRVLDVVAGPADGSFVAEIRADRTAVALLKSSFDPRWRVTVDGAEARPEMVAPGFVGVRVPAGRHRVRFTYAAYPWYWALFLLGGASMAALLFWERRSRSRAGARADVMSA
jgi:hypothetical protein